MATRLYFPDGTSAPVTPLAPGAEWEHINASGNIDQKLLLIPDSTALATVAYTPDAADDITNRDANHRQYVSDPLMAQTITGNVKAQFQCLEANAGNNLFLTLVIKVIVNGGGSARGTLLAITRDTGTELGTALANRNFPSTALSSVAALEGDRLLVEVGLGGTPVASGGVQGHNGSIRWGCSAAGGDLAENDTETGTTFRPWIEFTFNLEFFPRWIPRRGSFGQDARLRR